MSLLVLDSLAKRFGAIVVAEDVSFSLNHGEALGIIGPNGAGKTSLFNLIAGSYAPDGGTMSFNGRDITRSTARTRARAGIARTFQIPQPFGGMSVFENCLVAATAGAGMGLGEARHFAAGILERTGLAVKADMAAGALSLLDRKRLELARAMAVRPQLLLLDEVAGGLTEPECLSLVATIQTIRAEGVAIIWIEHIVHALLHAIDWLMVLNVGRVLTIGKPDQVIADPKVRQIYLGIEPP